MIKVCKNCGKDFLPLPGFKTLCSKECHKAVSYSPEVKLKQSKAQSAYYKNLSNEQRTEYNKVRGFRLNVKDEYYLDWVAKVRLLRKERRNMKPWDELSRRHKREIVLEEQGCRCFHCKNSHWNKEILPLELDHIDGDTSNNSRDNLRALCPNCHSITPTWRGRNCAAKRNVKSVSDQELIEALKSQPSARIALLSLGLSARGKNIERANQLLEKLK